MPNFIATRREYTRKKLSETEMCTHPMEQFNIWFKEALAYDIVEANAMALATSNQSGQPSVRMVLLKNYDSQGFAFYTNYGSSKAKDLEQNPYASLMFWWGSLERQIRVEGKVEKTSDSESDKYFSTRTKMSRLAAISSPQSNIVKGRKELLDHFEEVCQEYKEKPIVRPKNWGGYRLFPSMVEFWQGGEHRLHDRIRYQLTEGSWHLDRLAP